MMEMSAENLKYITDIQLRYIQQKALNILAIKMNEYKKLVAALNKTDLNFNFCLHRLLLIWIINYIYNY